MSLVSRSAFWSVHLRFVVFVLVLLGCQAKHSSPESVTGERSLGTFRIEEVQSFELPPIILASEYSDQVNVAPYKFLTAKRSQTSSGYLELSRRYDFFKLPLHFVTAIPLARLRDGQLTSNNVKEIVFVNFATTSDRIELEFYGEETGYQVVQHRVVTPLSASYHFGKMNFFLLKNGDLMGIKYQDTGSGSLEVHVLTRASNYQRFSLQTGTMISEQEARYYRCQARTLDLVCIRNDIDNRVQLRILDPNTNYRSNKLLVRTSVAVTELVSEEFTLLPPYRKTRPLTRPNSQVYQIKFMTRNVQARPFSWATSDWTGEEPMASPPVL